MNIVLKNLSLVFFSLMFFACSYYGKNTYLEPQLGKEGENKNQKMYCEEQAGGNIGKDSIEVKVGGTLLDSNKLAYSFVGVPYMPAVVDISVAQEITISYSNIYNHSICSIDDISLRDENSRKWHTPKSVWKSKILRKEKGLWEEYHPMRGERIDYVACTYTFGDLSTVADYMLRFKNQFSGCTLRDVFMKRIESDKIHHNVLLQ